MTIFFPVFSAKRRRDNTCALLEGAQAAIIYTELEAVVDSMFDEVQTARFEDDGGLVTPEA